MANKYFDIIVKSLMKHMGKLINNSKIELLLKRVDGSQVRRQNRDLQPGGFSEEMDLSALPSNLYYLEVRSGNSLLLRKVVGN